jgi:formamidopyrimidine-DNA glycosylase
MPELPEVENVCRGLIPVLKGNTLTSVQLNRENLRYPFPLLFTERLQDKVVESLERRAKYILISFHDDPYLLVVHLGMSGRFRVEPTVDFQVQKHDHVIFTTNQGKNVTYNDARRFGLMDLIHKENWLNHYFFKHLGPEPFDPDFGALHFHQRLRDKKQPIKQVILDQQVLVGVGNIYASESLWQSQIHPLKEARELSETECETLLDTIKAILKKSIEAGGSTLNDYHRPDGEAGCFQHQFKVYSREHLACLRLGCAGFIKKHVQAGRSTFFCPLCQG